MCGCNECLCGGHRTTLSTNPCLPPCLGWYLGWDIYLWVYRFSCPAGCPESSFVCLYPTAGTQGLWMWITKFSFIWVLGIQSQVLIFAQQEQFTYWATLPLPQHLQYLKILYKPSFACSQHIFQKQSANVTSKVFAFHAPLQPKSSMRANRTNTPNEINQLIRLQNIVEFSQSFYPSPHVSPFTMENTLLV